MNPAGTQARARSPAKLVLENVLTDADKENEVTIDVTVTVEKKLEKSCRSGRTKRATNGSVDSYFDDSMASKAICLP